MHIFSNNFASLLISLNPRLLFWRYKYLCRHHRPLSFKDVAFLSGLDYSYLSRVCNNSAGISIEHFKVIYKVLYNDLLINGELK